MKTAICPGSFDPVTVGHVDIIRRAAKLFDKVIVVVMINYHKPNSYFTASERVELLKRSLGDIKNVEIDMYSGLLAEYADKKQYYTGTPSLEQNPNASILWCEEAHDHFGHDWDKIAQKAFAKGMG